MFHRHCEIAIAQLSTIMMAVKSLALDGKKMREQCNFQIRKLVLIPFVCIGPLWLPCVVYLKSLLTPQAPEWQCSVQDVVLCAGGLHSLRVVETGQVEDVILFAAGEDQAVVLH